MPEIILRGIVNPIALSAVADASMKLATDASSVMNRPRTAIHLDLLACEITGLNAYNITMDSAQTRLSISLGLSHDIPSRIGCLVVFAMLQVTSCKFEQGVILSSRVTFTNWPLKFSAVYLQVEHRHVSMSRGCVPIQA